MLGAGLLVILPIGITLLVLKFFFELLDPNLRPLLEFLPGPYITGSGLAALIVAIYLIGVVASHVVGRKLISIGHLVMERIPVVKSIYGTTRSGVEMLTGSKDVPYRGVVLVEFPRTGMKSIGLVTSYVGGADGSESVFVYIPTTPVPSSGFLVLVEPKDLIPLEMTVEDAMKIIVSGGILAKDLFVGPKYSASRQGSELREQSNGISPMPTEMPESPLPDLKPSAASPEAVGAEESR